MNLRNPANTTAYGYSTTNTDSGNDTYIFGAGAVQDTINDYGSAAGNIDTIKIVGVPSSGVTPGRAVSAQGFASTALGLKLNGTSSQLTVQNYFAFSTNKR